LATPKRRKIDGAPPLRGLASSNVYSSSNRRKISRNGKCRQIAVPYFLFSLTKNPLSTLPILTESTGCQLTWPGYRIAFLRGAKCQSSAEGRRIAIRIRRSLPNARGGCRNISVRCWGVHNDKTELVPCEHGDHDVGSHCSVAPGICKSAGRGRLHCASPPRSEYYDGQHTRGWRGRQWQPRAQRRASWCACCRLRCAALRRYRLRGGGFERLPALIKRRILRVHSAAAGAGEQDGSENLNGERS
jgi:hypothetical protein